MKSRLAPILIPKLVPLLVANLFAAAGVLAAEGEDGALTGSVTLGVQGGSLLAPGETDSAKLREYRDIEGGKVVGRVLGGFDIRSRNSTDYLDFYGENLGSDDQYIDLRGGLHGVMKYQIYENRMVHNWSFGAVTPYSGVGTSTLTATYPAPIAATPPFPATTTPYAGPFNSFDLSQKRDKFGLGVEFSQQSPWYFRYDYNQARDTGLKLMGGSNSTSPGGGFVDKPFPIDWNTENVSMEGGYADKTRQLSVSLMNSRFTNSVPVLNWTNNFFGSQLDHSTLPSDSDYTKLGVNGALKALPMGSTLAGRLTYSKTTNNIPILASMPTGNTPSAANDPTQPSVSTFNGEVVHKSLALSLHSNPTRELDSRVYANRWQKDNHSPLVTFGPAATTWASNLACSGAPCVTELINFKKTNLGAEVGYRATPSNRLIFGADYVDTERDRLDYDRTKDRRASVEWRNTSLDWLSSRLKTQYLQRRSDFLEGASGTGATQSAFVNRFVSRFDAANVDQTLVKLGLDANPAELVDLGVEVILKDNKYKDITLGRKKDNRHEFYASAAYGDASKFRVMIFGDAEWVQYDAEHRNVSNSNTAPGSTTAFDATFPSTCQTVTNATTGLNSLNCNYNWTTKVRDKSVAVGLGVDWKPIERLKLKGSAISQRTTGTVDFFDQTSFQLPIPTTSISNYDNTRKLSLNLKGTYELTNKWDLTAGYAFERFRFDDIAYNNSQNVIAGGLINTNPNLAPLNTNPNYTSTSSSYYSGAFANPNYTANIGYVTATYRF